VRKDSQDAPKTSVDRLRCASYTRKSTEEGLDQQFNSLDPQRETAGTFIQTQRREGLDRTAGVLRRRRFHRPQHGTASPDETTPCCRAC
jgi:hypothetical protein